MFQSWPVVLRLSRARRDTVPEFEAAIVETATASPVAVMRRKREHTSGRAVDEAMQAFASST